MIYTKTAVCIFFYLILVLYVDCSTTPSTTQAAATTQAVATTESGSGGNVAAMLIPSLQQIVVCVCASRIFTQITLMTPFIKMTKMVWK